MSLRVLVADDHPIVRAGVRAVLETQADLCVVGEAADGLAVLPLVEQLRPDVLVLDLMLPGIGGLELTRQIRHRAPQVCVVILSLHADEAYVVEALRAGARGYILKKAASSELVAGLRAAVAGRLYLSASLSREALTEYGQAVPAGAVDRLEALTPRERDVLSLLATGLTNKQIATCLHIGLRTVQTHRADLMGKLDLHTVAELTRYAVHRGLIPPD